MVDVMRSFVLAEHAAGAAFSPAVGPPGYARVLAPHRRPHATTDGHVAVMPYSPADWRSVFRAFERDDLADDDRLASHRAAIEHAPQLYGTLGGLLQTFSTEECLRRITAAGVACAPLATLEEMIASCAIVEHPVAGPYRHLPTGVSFGAATTGPAIEHAPLQGQHTAEILRDVGVPERDIVACLADLKRTRGR